MPSVFYQNGLGLYALNDGTSKKQCVITFIQINRGFCDCQIKDYRSIQSFVNF